MHSKPRFSLLKQTGIIIGLISLLAVIGIGSSAFITQTIQGAATTINTSGALRMLSYKIATQMMRDQRKDNPTSTKIRGLIRRFDSKLNSPSLQQSIPQPRPLPKGGGYETPLHALYRSVRWQWDEDIKPLLLSYAALLDIKPKQVTIEPTKAKIHDSYQQTYLSKIDEFVFDINNMVSLIEEQTEDRIQLLRNIEFISLPLLLLTILAAPILLYYRILVPLKDLLQISEQVRRRDFSRQSKYIRNDELGELAKAFNMMNSDLSATYTELEEKITEKTQSLIDESNRITLMEERNTIAQELHDSLAQSIFYLNIQIGRINALIKQGASHDHLSPIINELRDTNGLMDRQLRELISTFRIKTNQEGIEASVDKIIEKQRGRSTTELEFNNQIPEFSFSHNEETCLIQIIQEAVANIIKHAGAKHGSILLKEDKESGEIMLTVRDDGVGITENPHRTNHFGLNNMEERALNINGSLTIQAHPHGGTEVRLSFTPSLPQQSKL